MQLLRRVQQSAETMLYSLRAACGYSLTATRPHRGDGMPNVTLNPWDNLIEALTLLAKHPTDKVYPIRCECGHGSLEVMANPRRFTEGELAHLELLGFNHDYEERFYSYRFGSGINT